MRTILSKLKTREQISHLCEQLRNQGKKIVTTNGVFDLLHVGHVTYLENARALGDVLVVGINSDASVRRIKGPKRPLNEEHARACCIAALECVDFVIIFDEDTPVSFLEQARPTIHVKGGDYLGKEDRMVEKEIVASYGGRIELKGMVKGYSTTSLIEKIVKTYGKSY